MARYKRGKAWEASGKVWSKTLKHRKSAKQSGLIACPRCDGTAIETRQRTFKDGSIHSEVRCKACAKFIKWGEE